MVVYFVSANETIPVGGGSPWQHGAVRIKDTKPVANRLSAMDCGRNKNTKPARILPSGR